MAVLLLYVTEINPVQKQEPVNKLARWTVLRSNTNTQVTSTSPFHLHSEQNTPFILLECEKATRVVYMLHYAGHILQWENYDALSSATQQFNYTPKNIDINCGSTLKSGQIYSF